MSRWDQLFGARRENVLAALRAIKEQKLRSCGAAGRGR